MAIQLVVILGDLGAVALVIVKRSKRADQLIVMNKGFLIMQFTVSALMLFALLLGFSIWACRVATSLRHGMTWTKRRTDVARVCAHNSSSCYSITRVHRCINHIAPHPGHCEPVTTQSVLNQPDDARK